MSNFTLVFWPFIEIFISIVTLFVIAIVLYLVDVLLDLLVFLDSGCIYSYLWRVFLLVSITTLISTRIFYVLLSSSLTKLDYLSTSIIRKTRGRGLFSINVSYRIIALDRPNVLNILTIDLFYQKHRLLSGLSFGVNYPFKGFFSIIYMSVTFGQLYLDGKSKFISKIPNKGLFIWYFWWIKFF